MSTSFHIRVSARGIVINEDKILLNEFGGGKYYNIPGVVWNPEKLLNKL